MKLVVKIYAVVVMLWVMGAKPAKSQEKPLSLNECIQYALENSTTMGRAGNTVVSQKSALEQKKAQRGPDLSLSANESLSSGNSYSNTEDKWNRETSSNMSVSLSSNITLYNGARIKNAILQGEINVSAAETDIKTKEELLSLDVLSAFISVLQAKEQVKNSQSQLNATEKLLEEASIKREAGVMSPADYLNTRSQFASDKASLVNSESSLRLALVGLMQTMNMPVSNSFDIVQPDTETLLKLNTETDAGIVYNVALGIQPGVKTAQLELESAEYDIQLAKGNYLPKLSLNGGLQTNYSSVSDINWGDQLTNQVTPALGLSLSIPIYQRKEVKNNVKQAAVARDNYEYALTDIKNDLRKSIEQACLDVQIAQSSYQSYEEQYLAEQESYKLAQEMFEQGMLSSVDFNTSKNNLSAAENNFTGAKYDLILQNEIVEYYLGNKIEL